MNTSVINQKQQRLKSNFYKAGVRQRLLLVDIWSEQIGAKLWLFLPNAIIIGLNSATIKNISKIVNNKLRFSFYEIDSQSIFITDAGLLVKHKLENLDYLGRKHVGYTRYNFYYRDEQTETIGYITNSLSAFITADLLTNTIDIKFDTAKTVTTKTIWKKKPALNPEFTNYIDWYCRFWLLAGRVGFDLATFNRFLEIIKPFGTSSFNKKLRAKSDELSKTKRDVATMSRLGDVEVAEQIRTVSWKAWELAGASGEFINKNKIAAIKKPDLKSLSHPLSLAAIVQKLESAL